MNLEKILATLSENLLDEFTALSEREKEVFGNLVDKNPNYIKGNLVSFRNERLLKEESRVIPLEKRQRIQELYDQSNLYQAVPQVAKLYIKHYRKKREQSLSLSGFLLRYNAKTRRLNNRPTHLQKYQELYRIYGMEEGLTFSEFLCGFLDTKLKNRFIGTLIERGENAPRDFSIEQGLQAYVKHYEQFKERSTSLGEFFRAYSPITLERGKGACLLKRHYNSWYSQTKGNSSEFEIYLINQTTGELKSQLENIKTTLSNHELDSTTISLLEKAAEEFIGLP